jgi:hypothetical protein
MTTCGSAVASFDSGLVGAAIAALKSSMKMPEGVRERTVEDLSPGADGTASASDLARELGRIAQAAGTSFEWITTAEDFSGKSDPRIPLDWRTIYRRLDIAVGQGNSEGWILNVNGVRRDTRSSGQPETADVIMRAKYLGSRYELEWIAIAFREFMIA